MKHSDKICFLIIFLCVNTLLSFSQQKSKMIEKINGKDYYIHQIKKGESLYGISKLYGVESEIILNENPSVKEQGLKAGYNLLIPVIVKSEKKPDNDTRDTLNFIYHKVMKGQTVYSICKQYNITQEEFYSLNPNTKMSLKENDWVIIGKKRNKQNADIIKDTSIVIQEKNNFESFDKRTNYTIALLLPFGTSKTDELIVEDLIKNQQNFPALSSMMIDFLKGFEYAADSLRSDSFNIRLLPIDITEKDSLKLTQIVADKTYKNTDIVIGPAFSSLIKLEQNINKDEKFHIIPFITQNKFLFNHSDYSKTAPSLYVDIKALAYYVFDSLRENKKVILIYNNVNNEREYAKEFRKYYNELVRTRMMNIKDTIRTFKTIADFKKFVKDNENYTVVLLTNNQVIATDYITQLSIINKNSPITLCGFYKTINFDNLDMEYLNQMKFVFSYYQNLNYYNIFNNAVKRYKQEFFTDPSVFFYEGFQTGLYYLNLIKDKGLGVLYHLNEYSSIDKNNFISFAFSRPDENTGFQNNAVFIYQIADRKIVLKRCSITQ